MVFYPCAKKRLSEVSASYTYFEDGDALLAKVTPCFENGKAGVAKELLNGVGFGSSKFYVFRTNNRALPEWIYFCAMHPFFRNAAIAQMTGTGGLQRVPRSFVENFQIPLPPLKVQQEIVTEIEGYQKIIDGARAVMDNYKPQIQINPDLLENDTASIKAEGGRGIAMVHITKTVIKQREFSVPPLETQTKIVAQIEKEQSLVNANKELITLFEQKIKNKIASIWGE